MPGTLNSDLKNDLVSRGFSRRAFGRIAAMIGAGATLPFYNEPALAQFSKVNAPPDAILLNANENPLGPCKEAREAAYNMIAQGGRYRYNEGDRLQQLQPDRQGLHHLHVGRRRRVSLLQALPQPHLRRRQQPQLQRCAPWRRSGAGQAPVSALGIDTLARQRCEIVL